MENMCRTCFRYPNKLFDIKNDTSFIEKIETISSIKLTDTIDLLSTICEECVINIRRFYNFRKIIINNDKDLKERYACLQKTKTKNNFQEAETLNTNSVKVEAALNDLTSSDTMIYFSDKEEGKNELNISNELEMEQINHLVNTREYECTVCKVVFRSRSKLYNHKRTVHDPRGVCNICGLSIRQDNLSRHVQMHYDTPRKCNECGKSFKNMESLRCHLLIHRGDIYTCHICGKMSKLKSEHGRHLKIHADPEFRKTMCTVCGKKVRDFKRHMQVHTGERPYICTYCNKGFTSPYALKVHTRRHTNERPFQCEYCAIAFPQKVSLTTHLRSKHGKHD